MSWKCTKSLMCLFHWLEAHFALPKSRQIHKSFCGGCPVHSFAESACEPHQTMISALLHFCCVHKCPSRTRLAHISHYCSFLHKITNEKTCFRNEPETYLAFARAMAVFKMLLWLDTFSKKVTATRGFRHDCLQNSCETQRNSYDPLLFWNAVWLYLSFAHRRWPRLC